MPARKGMSKTIVIIIVVIAIIAITSVSIAHWESTNENYDNFAKCLTEKGVVIYGSATCPHCQDQKKMFGDSFKYINYIECSNDPRCAQAGVQYVPTWSINGTLQPAGGKTIQELSSLTGCQVS
jgi:glutaredoxin